MSEFILSVDQGSSSSRALLFDLKGRLVARAQVPVATRFPKPGWAEQDPGGLVRGVERAVDSVLSRISSKDQVLGLGITSQRSTVLFWDKKNGRPVLPALSWQDARASSLCASWNSQQPEIHSKTGLYLTPFFSAPKIRWVLENIPDARKLAQEGRLLAGSIPTYLVWRWTKGERHTIDPTLAQRTLLMNLSTLDWGEELLKLFDVPRAILPEVLPSAYEYGVLNRKGRKIPILTMLGDQQAAALGLWGFCEGNSIINYGTGAFFLTHTGAKPCRVPGLLTSVAWQGKDRGACYFLEGTVNAAGSCLDWLKENLGVLNSVKEAEKLCRKSKSNLLALPALGGLGAPRWDFSTPACFWGLTAGTRREDLVRAMIEGIAFLIADIVQVVRKAGVSPGDIRVSGGLSRLDFLLQFQSDVLQADLMRFREKEMTASGAALLVAQALGYKDASFSGGFEDKVFRPRISPPESERLLAAWQKFVEGVQTLNNSLKS